MEEKKQTKGKEEQKAKEFPKEIPPELKEIS